MHPLLPVLLTQFGPGFQRCVAQQCHARATTSGSLRARFERAAAQGAAHHTRQQGLAQARRGAVQVGCAVGLLRRHVGEGLRVVLQTPIHLARHLALVQAVSAGLGTVLDGLAHGAQARYSAHGPAHGGAGRSQRHRVLGGGRHLTKLRTEPAHAVAQVAALAADVLDLFDLRRIQGLALPEPRGLLGQHVGLLHAPGVAQAGLVGQVGIDVVVDAPSLIGPGRRPQVLGCSLLAQLGLLLLVLGGVVKRRAQCVAHCWGLRR